MALNFEGLADIPPFGGDDEGSGLFRFTVSAVDKKLTIRLEDRKSKRQWRTPDLRIEDFTTSVSTIPQATTLDYADHFVECFRAAAADIAAGSHVYERAISGADKDGSRVLKLKLKLALGNFSAWLQYDFMLLPVALESVDLLAAQVRDLQDEMNDWKQQRSTAPRAHADFVASATTEAGGTIMWTPCRALDPERFAVDASGVLQIHKGGSYFVSVTVNHCSSSATPPIDIQLNDTVLRREVDSSAGDFRRQAAGSFPVYVEDHAKLSVVYRGNNKAFAANSFLDVVEL